MGLTVSAPKIGTLATGWNSRWASRWWDPSGYTPVYPPTSLFRCFIVDNFISCWNVTPCEGPGGVNLSRLSLNPNGAPPIQGGKKHPCGGVSPTHPWDRGIWGGGDAWEIRGISGGCCWIHPHLTYSSPITHQRCSELLTFRFTAITGILGQGPSNPAEIPVGFYLFKHKTPPFSRRGGKDFFTWFLRLH